MTNYEHIMNKSLKYVEVMAFWVSWSCLPFTMCAIIVHLKLVSQRYRYVPTRLHGLMTYQRFELIGSFIPVVTKENWSMMGVAARCSFLQILQSRAKRWVLLKEGPGCPVITRIQSSASRRSFFSEVHQESLPCSIQLKHGVLNTSNTIQLWYNSSFFQGSGDSWSSYSECSKS